MTSRIAHAKQKSATPAKQQLSFAKQQLALAKQGRSTA